ncbi:MAG TPA: PfkB family carbohydrate kinase [Actinomycetota bacterium]|jgi:ribokinase
MRTAVVGHVEWVEFGRVDAVPRAGAIAHATDAWEVPGGGGSVAAVQLARLSGACTFYTALGDDPRGTWARAELARLGLQVEGAARDEPTRRAIVFVDDAGERTITTLGERLEPSSADPLLWHALGEVDAAFVTAGDPSAVREARRARVLVATTRVLDLLDESAVPLDAVVGSARDPAERYEPGRLVPPPGLVVLTEGRLGGRWETADGRRGRFDAVEPPGPIVDTYGAGDSFAGGLTYALGAGMEVEEAVALAARCGAWCVAGRGPYGNQLNADDLD